MWIGQSSGHNFALVAVQLSNSAHDEMFRVRLNSMDPEPRSIPRQSGERYCNGEKDWACDEWPECKHERVYIESRVTYNGPTEPLPTAAAGDAAGGTAGGGTGVAGAAAVGSAAAADKFFSYIQLEDGEKMPVRPSFFTGLFGFSKNTTGLKLTLDCPLTLWTQQADGSGRKARGVMSVMDALCWLWKGKYVKLPGSKRACVKQPAIADWAEQQLLQMLDQPQREHAEQKRDEMRAAAHSEETQRSNRKRKRAPRKHKQAQHKAAATHAVPPLTMQQPALVPQQLPCSPPLTGVAAAADVPISLLHTSATDPLPPFPLPQDFDAPTAPATPCAVMALDRVDYLPYEQCELDTNRLLWSPSMAAPSSPVRTPLTDVGSPVTPYSTVSVDSIGSARSTVYVATPASMADTDFDGADMSESGEGEPYGSPVKSLAAAFDSTDCGAAAAGIAGTVGPTEMAFGHAMNDQLLHDLQGAHAMLHAPWTVIKFHAVAAAVAAGAVTDAAAMDDARFADNALQLDW